MKIARFCKNNNREQYVKEHLCNVEKYCENIATKVGLKYTASIIGKLHDIGKLSAEYQNYICSLMESEDDRLNIPKVDHAVYGAKYLYDIKSEDNEFSRFCAEIMSFVICYHHGGLPNCIEGTKEIPFLNRLNKIEQAKYVYVINEFQNIFPDYDLNFYFKKACKEINEFITKIDLSASCNDECKFSIHLLIKTLYSVLIDSDWLDAYLFEIEQEYKKEPSLSDYIDVYLQNMQDKIDSFSTIKPKNSRQEAVFQKRYEISQDCRNFSERNTGIYTLTVPTGGGKTLSSFIFALEHAKKKSKDRIFYVAPYTSIIEQNASAIREAINCGDNLLEYHSDVISDENEDANILSDRWNTQFVFTTMVQFLNTLYSPPSRNLRRMISLANSIIIFDEIQNIPIHCISLFNSAINFLNKCFNCTIILCTATQPVLDRTKRSIQLSEDSEIVKNVDDAYNKLKRVDVIDKTKAGGYTCEEVANFLHKVKHNKSSVLLVVNTINAAESIFNILKGMQPKSENGCKLFLLSANFCPSHRKDIVRQIKDALANEEDIICVSTQVIECGVDISFDTVIRSLAGLDSIAQAAGRCNRHGEKETSNAYIINLNNKLENTSKILTIDIGKKKTEGMLNLYSRNPGDFNNSLLSPRTISDYFKRFVNEENISKEFDYPLAGSSSSIYELLSTNTTKLSTYKSHKGSGYKLYPCYQFKKAREEFAVIEKQTKSVIVPYKEGKDLIDDLNSLMGAKQKLALIKKAQRYSVDIFPKKFEELIRLGGVCSCGIEGVYLLRENFYDDEIGVKIDKKLEFLSI